MKIVRALTLITTTLTLSFCGGGGGGSAGGSGATWRVQAPVTANGCGERIAPVTQDFVINESGDTVLVDTSIATAQGPNQGSDVEASYSEAFGDCTRTHTVSFRNFGGDSADVSLSSETTCSGGATCKNTWAGTATRVENKSAELEASPDYRVRGDACIQPVPQVGYRPSLFECNGTAAVLARDSIRNNYSVVVRRNGEFNDRDPNNPTCGSNRCSPYKTQKKMELPQHQVNCLGDSGFSELYDPVLRISIKFTALVTNANDPNQFEQYCINNVEQSFN